MKPAYFGKLLCLVLAVVFLAGCTEKEFDPETDDYANVNFGLDFIKLTNAEGKELHWSKNEFGDRVLPPLGSMQCSDYDMYIGGGTYVTVPYSKSFTAQPKSPPHGILPRFGAQFYKGKILVSNINVSGAFVGDVTVCDSNVVELDAACPDVCVRFSVYWDLNQDISDRRIKYLYILTGNSVENARIRLKGDEIVAEGMAGDYTVTKYEYPEKGDQIEQKVYTKTYSEDGTEK